MKKDWMIRTAKNHLIGPLTRDKLQEMVRGKLLEADDEICQSAGYWIRVKESALVREKLFQAPQLVSTRTCLGDENGEVGREREVTCDKSQTIPTNTSVTVREFPVINQKTIPKSPFSKKVLIGLILLSGLLIVMALLWRKNVIGHIVQ